MALKYTKQITTAFDRITTKIFNGYEFANRLFELHNVCEKKDMDDILILLKELKKKSISYFPDLKLQQTFEKWLYILEEIREKVEEVWEKTYLNLQFSFREHYISYHPRKKNHK